MATTFLKSSLIKAYPVVNRNTEVSGDIYSRHSSEYTATSIVNKLINSDGFVITQKGDSGDAKSFALNHKFSFNIHGYYFTVEHLSDIINAIATRMGVEVADIPDDTTFFAGINLEDNGYWEELAGSDTTSLSGNDGEPTADSYTYSSVYFFTDADTVSDYDYYLPLFTKSAKNSWGEGYYVKTRNYLKFYSNSIEVDGGDLD